MREREILFGVSSCLLGNAVRYDGGDKLDRLLLEHLGAFVTWVPVCPEVECGLPVPREPLRLSGAPPDQRLVGVGSGVDHTERMRGWMTHRLDELAALGLRAFVFKSRSPSCGLRGLEPYAVGSMPAADAVAGIFANALARRLPLLPIEDEEQLRDAGVRERFIARVMRRAPSRSRPQRPA